MIRVLLCAYNEAPVIGPLLRDLFAVLRQMGGPAAVLLVDDGSTDATVAVAREEAARHPDALFEVERHRRNRGLGAALCTGFAHILGGSDDDDVIVTLDADGTHPPRLLPQLVAKIEDGKELVIASRYQPGARVSGVPPFRTGLSHGARVLLRRLLPVPGVHDYTCCFRAYRAATLRRAQRAFGRELTDARGFEAVMDLLLRLRAVGVDASEVPIELEYAGRVGHSKMDVLPTIAKTLRLVGRRLYESRTVDSPDRVRERLAEAK